MNLRITSLLLNIAHTIDHLMLLVFATAVASIAREFDVGRWEDLMPCTTGAFVMFGIGSFPSGRLGNQKTPAPRIARDHPKNAWQ